MPSVRHLTYLFLCLLLLSCNYTSRWQKAHATIAIADSLDQNEHTLYPDTLALEQAIGTLDNPFGRLFAHNTLGKAHYYMGRHRSDEEQIIQAAAHYIAADRAQIDDPIYRGRINSCMAHICKQNESDSLALVFFLRANEAFKASGKDWYYAHTLLDVSEFHTYLHHFSEADSVLGIAASYDLDEYYQARRYETKGLYFYEQQQYDSALVYFKLGLPYWQKEEYRLYSYMKIMQVYLDMDSLAKAVPYAESIMLHTQSPTFLVNAYFCLMQEANLKNDTRLLSQYSHARADAEKALRDYVSLSAETVSKFSEYLANPYPLRWVWIVISCTVSICLLLIFSIMIYRRHSMSRLQLAHEEQIRIYDFHSCLSDIRMKYPAPPRRWTNYMTLAKDIDPYLHDWLMALEQLPLSARERIFCIYYMVYPHFSLVEIAKHINYAEKSIRTYKARIAAKLQCSSANLHDYLSSIR